MATPCPFKVFKNHPEMYHYLSFLTLSREKSSILQQESEYWIFTSRTKLVKIFVWIDFWIFLFLKVIDFMVDFRHENSNVWKWDNLIDLQPQWVDFNGKRALNIFFWESLSPLLLSPHEALGHKFWLKGGEREKKILGDTGSLSISLGQNITRKPWIIENMTWKN